MKFSAFFVICTRLIGVGSDPTTKTMTVSGAPYQIVDASCAVSYDTYDLDYEKTLIIGGLTTSRFSATDKSCSTATMGYVRVIDTSDGSSMTRTISPVAVGTNDQVNFVKVMLSQSG